MKTLGSVNNSTRNIFNWAKWVQGIENNKIDLQVMEGEGNGVTHEDMISVQEKKKNGQMMTGEIISLHVQGVKSIAWLR